MSWENNACGGARYRTLSNAAIEVEGVGVPAYRPGSLEFSYLANTWKNWKYLIRKYAQDEKIPASSVLAIASKETGRWSSDKQRQATITSPAGAVGVMQLMPFITSENRADPGVSFRHGSRILASHLRRFGSLPAAATAYNSGGVYCYEGPTSNPGVTPNEFGFKNEHNYSGSVVKYNNSAILYLNANSPSLLPWAFGGVVAASAGIYLLNK